MRWILAPVGVLLLLWLAHGDARAQAPGADIVQAVVASPAPNVAGVWVTLAPDACSPGRLLEARFQYGGQSYGVETPLPPCPSPPVFLGRALPAASRGMPTVATQAYIVERSLGLPGDDGWVQRYPESGKFLPAKEMAAPASPVPAVAWPAADVGVVSGLWAFAWWRDPSRLRAPSSPPPPGQ